jgi:hypothetical protein
VLKSLADLKRAMPVGTVVHVENHLYPALTGDRTVVVAQSNRWCLSLPAGHPRASESDGSWLDIPKAKFCTFNGNAVTIHRDAEEWGDAGPFCTITIPEEGQ